MARKLENNTQKDTSILPVEVIEIILSRLPVKSLLRFKTVSKSWQATISDPRFSEIFDIQQFKSQNLFLVLGWNPHWRPSVSFSLIKLENKKFRTESVLGYPFEPAIPLCSCNGLVFLRSFCYNVYVLWNPSIRTYTRIPSRHMPEDFPINFGLYHDPRIDDYRVVIISGKYYSIFSCKSRTWSNKKPFPCSRIGVNPLEGVFVDGSFYWWLCIEGRESYNKGKLVCFDVREEKLKKLQHPNDLKANDTDEVRLTGLTGRLCLYCMNKYRTKLQLWVMEKNGDHNYSWRELMKMEKEEPNLYFYKPICLTNEDNVLIHLQGSRFVIYNHCETRFEESWSFSGEIFSDLVPCSESMFFPFQNMRPKRKRSAYETSAKEAEFL